jgi:anti-sigma factor RsiW
MNEHLKDELQDLLSGQLDSKKKTAVEDHLKSCPECSLEFENLRMTKQIIIKHLQESETPADLHNKIRKMLDQEAPAATKSSHRWKSLLPYAAVLVLIAAALIYFLERRPDLASQVAKDYQRLKTGTMPLELRTNNVQDLEKFYTEHGMPFHVTVYDLSMMKYELVGGSIHQFTDSRKAAVYVYRGENNEFVICEMYLGTPSELPEDAALREHNYKSFHIYKRNGLTAVFWPEDEVMCVLVSDIDPERIIQLAFAKANPGKKSG